MSTLLIELAGPQQAWGSRSRFASRATELAPTKSGVLGMLAAALGLERTAPLDRFDDLRFGVRIDQPGRVERDFQTTRSFDGSRSFPLSQRYYLADAVFVAALESTDTDVLREYQNALRRPYFPLFLGRRAFPPAGPLVTDIVDLPLRKALEQTPWRAHAHHRRKLRGSSVTLEVQVDAEPTEPRGESRRDVPLSFDPRRREHAWRDVAVLSVGLPHPDADESEVDEEPPTGRGPASAPPPHTSRLLGSTTDHDPETLLSDEEV